MSRWMFFDFVDSLCMFLSARNQEKSLSVQTLDVSITSCYVRFINYYIPHGFVK